VTSCDRFASSGVLSATTQADSKDLSVVDMVTLAAGSPEHLICHRAWAGESIAHQVWVVGTAVVEPAVPGAVVSVISQAV
jgi:hypothetical protein